MFNKLGSKISALFSSKKLDTTILESLEELLITSDISYNIVTRLIDKIKSQKFGKETTDAEVKNIIKKELLTILSKDEENLEITDTKPFSIVMIGVNGSGKTSTIGKLANLYKKDKKSVAIVACDTFRISATEQLNELTKNNCDLFISKDNADPSGLAYDGFNQAKAKSCDIVMFDTAGRLSNNDNLMAELKKIIKTINKIDSSAPTKTILVLDGNGGQNSLTQMEKFSKEIKIDGIIITKTEGSSKSGFIISIKEAYNIPIYFITTGEHLDNIETFDKEKFINDLLGL